ncbi:MAG: hypothetical protein F4086_08995, partial [Gemmatimonadetes bacterium]|nr:hypothetical protein [Gemmatimonadota bacterium]
MPSFPAGLSFVPYSTSATHSASAVRSTPAVRSKPAAVRSTPAGVRPPPALRSTLATRINFDHLGPRTVPIDFEAVGPDHAPTLVHACISAGRHLAPTSA